ncbi:hypothetical protein ACROYT_G000144 [Oculina patagonica]
MNNASAANNCTKNATGSTIAVLSKEEGIALCSAFILVSVFIVVGNLLTIVLFALDKKLRKKSLFLVINMAFADLMLGALSIPSNIWYLGWNFQLWTAWLTMAYVLIAAGRSSVLYGIPEFKPALALYCLGREAAINGEGGERRNNATAAVTPATQLRTLRTDPSHSNLAFEQEVMDTKL